MAGGSILPMQLLRKQKERTEQMLNLYADFCEEVLAIPVVRGQKTDKEKFAGAEATYTIESLMHDGKALQSGTSHNFGDGFCEGIWHPVRSKRQHFKICTSDFLGYDDPYDRRYHHGSR